MNKIYKQIERGKRLTLDNKPITQQLYDKLILYFENKEEYEKCHFILKEKNKSLDHENNFVRKKI